MKLLVLVMCVAAAAADSSPSEFAAAIIRSDIEQTADGYSYNYETGNSINGQARGYLKKDGDHEFLGVQGSYSYVSPDNTPFQLTFVADENGYQPQSDSLPTPPPIPEAILRSIKYIEDHPPPVEKRP